MQDNKLWQCPFCEENITEHGFLCEDCARTLGEKADKADLINRSDF